MELAIRMMKGGDDIRPASTDGPSGNIAKSRQAAVSNAALTVLSAGAALILCGCNTDTMNVLWPTYEYQHQGRTPKQEAAFLKKTYPNDPQLWQRVPCEGDCFEAPKVGNQSFFSDTKMIGQ